MCRKTLMSWDTEPLNSAVFFASERGLCTPMGSTSPRASEEINPELPEETIMAYPKSVAVQDNAESPQDPPSPSLFPSRPVTILKTQ